MTNIGFNIVKSNVTVLEFGMSYKVELDRLHNYPIVLMPIVPIVSSRWWGQFWMLPIIGQALL